MQEKLSEIEEKIEHEKQKTHKTQCTTRRSLANLCEFLETYEADASIHELAETEPNQKEQAVAVAIEPALS